MKKYQLGALTVSDKGLQDTKAEIVIELIDRIAIGITTAIFIAAQYVSFLITGIEQTTLITYYFTAVVIEGGALMLKRVSEIIVARVKKKEQIEPETDTDESEVL